MTRSDTNAIEPNRVRWLHHCAGVVEFGDCRPIVGLTGVAVSSFGNGTQAR